MENKLKANTIIENTKNAEDEKETKYILQNESLMKQIRESLLTHNMRKGYKLTKEEIAQINSLNK
jgi:antitoxin YefM